MSQIHVQDLVHCGSIESSLRQAVTLGLLADADLTVDQTTTLAAIATRNASLLTTTFPLRPDLLSQYYALVEAIKLGFKILGSTLMITDTATIYAAIDGNWQPGFAVAC